MDETNIPELNTIDGVYVEQVNTIDIPKLTNEEADSKEQEKIEITEEGGL